MSKSAQIGTWGVLHVQRDLLSLAIDSAPMTTDTGIDLLAYDQKSRKSFSIQVKTATEKGLTARRPDWKVRKDKLSAAEVFAFVLKKDNPEGERGEAWYLSQKDLSRRVSLLGSQWALTFWRDGAAKSTLKDGRLTESEMKDFKGIKGLKKVLKVRS